MQKDWSKEYEERSLYFCVGTDYDNRYRCGASEERVYEVVVNEDIVDVNIANEISNESNFDEPSVYEETSAIPQELMESFDVNENFGPTTSHYIVVESKTTGCCYKVIWYNEDGEPEPSREEVQMGTIPCTDKGF